MAGSEYYDHTTYPATSATLSSGAMRSELDLIEAGFGKLPDLAANGGKVLAVNAGATALEAITTTGTGSGVRATSPTLVAPALGTPASGVLTNVTGTASGLTAGNVTTNANLTGHVTSTGNAAVLGAFTSLQLLTALTDETGTGAAVFGTSPTLVTPALGTPASGVATNMTGTAANLTAGTATVANGLNSATTTVSVSAATAPTSGQVLTATSTTAATWQTPGADSPIRINPRLITADLSIGSAYNAASVGPITVSDGITVTVGDNATWSIN